MDRKIVRERCVTVICKVHYLHTRDSIVSPPPEGLLNANVQFVIQFVFMVENCCCCGWLVGGCCRVEEFSWYIGRGGGGGGDEEVVNSYLRNEM